MSARNSYRRKLIKSALLIPLIPFSFASQRTPSASGGPFYPTERMRFDDIDNDLVRLSNLSKDAKGEVVKIFGKVLDESGSVIPKSVVEIWQCDANGRYLHTGDRGSKKRDDRFQGFGRAIADDQGAFNFRTIKPVVYPGRTPHIHVKVLVDGRERLTTQWYLEGHPENKNDFLYQRISSRDRPAVHLRFNDAKEPEASIQLVV